MYQDINGTSSLFVKSNQSTIQSFTNETLTFRARRNEKFRHQNQLGKWKKKEKAMPLKLLFVSLRQWRGLWMDICNPVTYIFSSSFSGNRICHLSRISNESVKGYEREEIRLRIRMEDKWLRNLFFSFLSRDDISKTASYIETNGQAFVFLTISFFHSSTGKPLFFQLLYLEQFKLFPNFDTVWSSIII